MAMERHWLHHAATGGYFHCPAEALDDWLALGWTRSETGPPEPNPVIAERIAWEREQAREAAQQPTTTNARRSAASSPKEQ